MNVCLIIRITAADLFVRRLEDRAEIEAPGGRETGGYSMEMTSSGLKVNGMKAIDGVAVLRRHFNEKQNVS